MCKKVQTQRPDTMNAYKAIATRIVNAEDKFAEIIVNIAGCDTDTAHAVTAYYLKNKIAKLDPVIGSINVKHGAFLEADVVARAVDAVS